MSVIEPVVVDESIRVLESAIADHASVVVTHQSSSGWRTCKGRFYRSSESGATFQVQLACTDDDGADGSWVRVGEQVGLTFRSGRKKWMLSTRVERVDARTDSLLCSLCRPTTLQKLSRRAFERTSPPPNDAIAVRFWSVDGKDHARAASETRVWNGQLEDLSAGGMSVRVPESADAPIGFLHRCAFMPYPSAQCLMVDGILRHRRVCERGRASLGFQFVGLEMTSEGRRTIERILRATEQFQRSRARLGR
jgi:c-di-GMP-binding flagellar brake protein YcgR